MAGKRELLVSVILYLAIAGRTSELVPFIAWSNSDALASLPASEDLSEITSSLSQKKADLTVLFVTSELSFDDVAKYGGVFGEGSSGGLKSLKAALKKAESQYWSGVSPLDSTWIIDFSHQRGEKVVFVNPYASDVPEYWHGVVVIDVSMFEDYADKDAVVKNVMSDLEKNNMLYLAIFTQGSRPSENVNLKGRSKRSTDPRIKRQEATGNGDCPIQADLGCILFCLTPPILFTPNITNSNSTCNLTTPSTSNITKYSCADDPYLILTFNVSRERTGPNNCSEVNNLFDKLGVTNSSQLLQFNFEFAFPVANSSDYYSSYSMIINAKISLVDGSSDKSSDTYTLERQHPPNLYNNFTVPLNLSYACSAENSPYNNYSSNDTGKVLNQPFLILNSIQVQPYGVQGSTFASAYNCVGYFTIATWMGIFTVIVLLLVFYLSIICTFSMKTVDRFEDPRGQTILVEKLH